MLMCRNPWQGFPNLTVHWRQAFIGHCPTKIGTCKEHTTPNKHGSKQTKWHIDWQTVVTYIYNYIYIYIYIYLRCCGHLVSAPPKRVLSGNLPSEPQHMMCSGASLDWPLWRFISTAVRLMDKAPSGDLCTPSGGQKWTSSKETRRPTIALLCWCKG